MVSFSGALTAAGWLLAGVAATMAHERFVAVETGAILSPRQYRMSPAHALDKRQGGCNPGSHPCDDIGPPGAGICCSNNQYCIVNPTDPTTAGCCRIGLTCNSPCDETAFQCDHTTTLTTSGTTTIPAGACCPRRCTGTSQFACPSSLGGGCCQYDQRCATGAGGPSCLFQPPPTTTLDPSLIAPPGCETGEITCAESLGGGCCDAARTCTLITGQRYCAEDPITPTGSGVSVVDVGDGGGLSAGATAGVAVGVVVGVGLLVGAVGWWWCVRRRRRGRRQGPAGEVGEVGEGVGDGASSVRPRPAGVVGRVVGGSGTGREMSDATSDMMSRSGRGGLAQDYFGPAPAVGPYSDAYNHNASPVTTPGLDRGGVPLQPHEPGDIAVPVEIDSRLREEGHTPVGLAITPDTNRSRDDRSRESEDATERYELYGSEIGQVSPTLGSPYAGGMPSPNERPK
ncbi:uncharacterized protein B0H64DRAFT_450139 [Chaetomium fimeti]|uniref:Uncharacterized protein n=1 Tax=Chaetomium fimeti TaxID=1854472 RepID=A0AAE0HT82_9PEZI|nr:hypothetical protein B0H64DRAFT_450139 [Chaetomium fimeti]